MKIKKDRTYKKLRRVSGVTASVTAVIITSPIFSLSQSPSKVAP